MSSKLITFFILITIESIVRSQTTEWCQEPWQKLNENICLEINSNIRPWSHAKLQCKYDGGELLYINNEEEQKTISANQSINTIDFFKQIIRYRFNLRTLVWLNLVKQSNDEWIWSQSNETLGYRNWNSNNPSGNANCACLKLKSKQTVKEDDWSWLSCDCNFSEHFVCRKPNPNSIVIKDKETTPKPPPATIPANVMPIEAREQKSVDMNNEIKSIIVSTKVLNDQEDVAASQSVESKNVRLLEELKKQTHFIRNSSLFINVYRTKILKTSILFTVEECPFGFGYYSVGKQSPPDCSQYKICENWDNKFAIIHLNKCADGKNFSFKDFLCVDIKSEPCTEENFRHFVPL